MNKDQRKKIDIVINWLRDHPNIYRGTSGFEIRDVENIFGGISSIAEIFYTDEKNKKQKKEILIRV